MQPSIAVSDEEVVRQVLAGETALFGLLVQRYRSRLHGAARAILRSDADAEDAVQQACLNAYRRLASYEGRAAFATWLTRIVIHEALARRRRRSSQPTDSLRVLDDRILCSTLDPERQALVGELGRVLALAVDALPDTYRIVFTLREVDGMSTTEAAERLCVSESAVKARLHRAKGQLKQTLAAFARAPIVAKRATISNP